jgi:pimeloyl-ACP methyl ester carboxylesterase
VNEAKKLCQKEFVRWYRLTYEINGLLKYFTDTNHRVPILYLMGDDDYMFLPYVRKLVSKQNLSNLVVISKSGHVCNVDQPEVFNRQAIQFIESLRHSN